MVQTHYGNTGWKCPSCGANLSPSTVSCPFHNTKITTTPNTDTPYWVGPHVYPNTRLSQKEQEENMFKVQPGPFYKGMDMNTYPINCCAGGVSTSFTVTGSQ